MAYYVIRTIIKDPSDNWDNFKRGFFTKFNELPSREYDDTDVEQTETFQLWQTKVQNCPVNIDRKNSVQEEVSENIRKITITFDTLEDAKTYYNWRVSIVTPSAKTYTHEIRDESGNLVSPD